MRHQKHTAKLGRKGSHRNAMLANLVCSLIKHRRVTTTLAKAKAARPVAEKLVTLGKKGSIHHRRLAASRLHQEDAVRILFNEIALEHEGRQGGYTRIIKLGTRRGDAAQTAILEWVEVSESSGSKGSAVSVKNKPAEAKQPEAEAPAEEVKDKASTTESESATTASSENDKKE
ncbi:MAG: 50S ribosomal protein L17 [Verrucomicrobia subdivision 3 bacterium]|nr:50S ribosomal protein L17 [Limisphaerales bacterium]MCS1415975.1 50S ribosomal protein L17 [Limisphaerales bacterium]